jgi:UPF0755 protein
MLKRFLIVLPLAVALVAGLVIAAGWWWTRPGPLTADAQVVVPRGTTAQLGEALRQAGVVGDARAFRVAALATALDGPLRAGEFAFPAHASLREVLAILRTARPVQHRLTLPEGLTAAAIARRLAAAEAADGPVEVPEEGAILPQTYEYERGTSVAALAQRAETAGRQTLARAWAGRAPGLPLASAREALILASVVERETGIATERALVAAVFENRLRAGMRLQSDPTVAYQAAGGEVLDRKLTRADLASPGAYNTYLNAGLPPGPICSPGEAALLAVLHPSRIGALYFVADGRGAHAFADTLAQHEANVARLRELR